MSFVLSLTLPLGIELPSTCVSQLVTRMSFAAVFAKHSVSSVKPSRYRTETMGISFAVGLH